MDSRIYILTHKRLTGQLSSVENDELKQLTLISENKALSEELAYLWNISKTYFPTKDWQKDAAKEAFYQRIKEPVTAVQSAPSAKRTNTIVKILVGVIILLLGIMVINYLLKSPDYQVIEAKEAVEYAEIMDGTKVWLDEGAKLTILSELASTRKVALEGEAVFDVKYNPSSPFEIDLGADIAVEVLGTSFKVRSTHDGATGLVAVREGKVRLYNKKDARNAIILTTGEVGEIMPGDIPIKDQIDPFTSFSTEEFQPLKFNNTPLDKVFTQLGMFYGVTFSFDDSISKCSYSGVVHNNVVLDETMEALQEVHPNILIIPTERSTYKILGTCN